MEGTGSNWRGHGEPLFEMEYVFLLFLPKGIGFKRRREKQGRGGGSMVVIRKRNRIQGFRPVIQSRVFNSISKMISICQCQSYIYYK